MHLLLYISSEVNNNDYLSVSCELHGTDNPNGMTNHVIYACKFSPLVDTTMPNTYLKNALCVITYYQHVERTIATLSANIMNLS